MEPTNDFEANLNLFVSIDNELCQNGEFPDLEYAPRIYGIVKPAKESSCLTPGFNVGDPCEYGFVTFENAHYYSNVRNRYSDDIFKEILQNTAILSSFVWLLGLAHYQGFNTLVDITYPMTTQTVLTDGHRFSFYAYQLNTMDLIKDKIANPFQNICWYTDEKQLYEKIEGDKVIGFNDEVCEMLVKMLLMKPVDRNVIMKPTFQVESLEQLKQTEFISKEPLQKLEQY